MTKQNIVKHAQWNQIIQIRLVVHLERNVLTFRQTKGAKDLVQALLRQYPSTQWAQTGLEIKTGKSQVLAFLLYRQVIHLSPYKCI